MWETPICSWSSMGGTQGLFSALNTCFSPTKSRFPANTTTNTMYETCTSLRVLTSCTHVPKLLETVCLLPIQTRQSETRLNDTICGSPEKYYINSLKSCNLAIDHLTSKIFCSCSSQVHSHGLTHLLQARSCRLAV